MARITSAAVVYSLPSSSGERKTMHEVKKALRLHSLSATFTERSNTSAACKKADLVISVGGDGTFLSAARMSGRVPVLGVNSDPSTKAGYLLMADVGNIWKILEQVRSGSLVPEELSTLEASINGKKLDEFAINEFFIGAAKSYRTSRYTISLNGKSEVHRSSGVIVATPLGIHAWAQAALGHPLSIPREKYCYVVREPYEQKIFADYHLKRGMLSNKDSWIITSKMSDCIVVADSLGKEFPVKRESTVTVKKAKRTVFAYLKKRGHV